MGREHFVPLTPLMRAILEAQPKRTANPLVFPSAVSGGVINGWSKLLPRLSRLPGSTSGLTIHEKSGADADVHALASTRPSPSCDRPCPAWSGGDL